MSKLVLVTGISGYIGQHCAVELIRNGYRVRGSVRNLDKSDKVTADLNKVIDTQGNLEFCRLDLLQDAGWDEALAGCDYLLHVASPFIKSEPKNEDDLIRPAVDGTRRALSAAKKAGIKRVVLTSSMVAMIGGSSGEFAVDQDSWTDVNARGVSAYLKSKTLAEKAAWEFIEEQTGADRMELVVVNPGPVYGPTLSDRISGASLSTYRDLILGKTPMLPKAAINMSDVRDVAKIHVRALTNDAAAGRRFIVSSERAYSFKEMAEVLVANGYDKVSTREAPNFLLKFLARFSADMKGMLPFIGNTVNGDISATKRVFDYSPTPFERTVVDTAKSVEAVLRKA